VVASVHAAAFGKKRDKLGVQTMRPSLLVLVALVVWEVVSPRSGRAQVDAPINLDKVYTDESHCLVDPEIRSAADKPSSCYCRDAIADARYVRQTYLKTGKDRNLNGIYLVLEVWAGQRCGDGYDVLKAEESKWNGPEVRRTYPPNSSIEKIKPDSNGFRTVTYEVQLTYRDQQGRVTKVENFRAAEKLPPDFKNSACPPTAVCPK
jgi:hypothetical protein